MNLGASDVNLYLEMVQNEMIQIVEKANVDMIMQAVRLNLELPADVRLKSLVDQELDQLPVVSAFFPVFDSLNPHALAVQKNIPCPTRFTARYVGCCPLEVEQDSLPANTPTEGNDLP
jgi:hypothetical protein